MSRWIDADAWWKAVQKYYTDGDCADDDRYELGINVGITKSRNVMMSAPSNDIVRCKDCKYWVSDGGALMICDIHKDPTVPDHYCSYGEEDKDEDLIKREDAIKVINLRARIPHDVVSAQYASMAINAIRSVTSADRPQGEWLKDDEGTFICSACGSGYKDQPTLMGKPMFKWCPLCGARMKGADDES